jgi:hypothetical protein
MNADEQLVMKLVSGINGMERYPELMEEIGRYVTGYEPRLAPKGEQWIWTTDDLDEALGFDDAEQLYEVYNESIGTRPWDGKPNRPITAFTVEIAMRKTFR